MEFPVELKHTGHKFGGRILRVHRIAHGCDKPEDGRSRDWWWYVGDIEWEPGKVSCDAEIAPYHLCYLDDDQDEVHALSAALSDYLAEHGEWCDGKSKHEGWYANERPTPKRRRA